MPLEHAGLTDTGRVRSANEDCFRIDGGQGLFLVADGMGGHNAGDVASRMAADIITRHFAAVHELPLCIELANTTIFEASQSDSHYAGMGTTVVALAADRSLLTVAWVGDSRMYLVRDGKIRQVTTDHSLVQEQIQQGLLAEEDRATAPHRNILTRAVGTAPVVTPGTVTLHAQDGDLAILCSDGLHGMIADERIREIVLRQRDLSAACQQLIGAANDAGGRDNITVVIVRYAAGGFWSNIFS